MKHSPIAPTTYLHRSKQWMVKVGGLLMLAALVLAMPGLRADSISFSSSLACSSSQPATTSDSIANWTGAAFDAQNVGGSGTNADGGSNNGTTNDATTVVSASNPAQGQTFDTGSAVNGYDLTVVTVRIPPTPLYKSAPN